MVMDEMPRGIINGERGIADSQERLAELSTSCTLLWLAWLPKPGCSFPLKMGNTLLKLKKKNCRVRLKMQSWCLMVCLSLLYLCEFRGWCGTLINQGNNWGSSRSFHLLSGHFHSSPASSRMGQSCHLRPQFHLFHRNYMEGNVRTET